MARKEFTDNQTTISSDWLNKIDASVVDGIGEKKTPDGVRTFIGADRSGAAAAVQSDLDSHKADSDIHYPDAPNDGKSYIRRNQMWVENSAASSDHQSLGNRDAIDAHPQSAITNLTTDLAAKASSQDLTNHINDTDAHIGDVQSPVLDEYYGRRNGVWAIVPTSGDGVDPTDHAALNNLDGIDQHPISTIIGLSAELGERALSADLSAHMSDVAEHIGHATPDGRQYVSKNGAWVELVGVGSDDHSTLLNRGLADQHPIASITDLDDRLTEFDNHEANTNNPHNVTAAQAGADPAGSAQIVQNNLDAYIGQTVSVIIQTSNHIMWKFGAGKTGDVCITGGHELPNTPGGGIWFWDEDIDTLNADLGTIIDPMAPFSVNSQGSAVGNGCWVRQFEGDVNAIWYSAVGDGSFTTANDFSSLTGTDNTASISRAIEESIKRECGCYIPSGIYKITTLDTEGLADKHLDLYGDRRCTQTELNKSDLNAMTGTVIAASSTVEPAITLKSETTTALTNSLNGKILNMTFAVSSSAPVLMGYRVFKPSWKEVNFFQMGSGNGVEIADYDAGEIAQVYIKGNQTATGGAVGLKVYNTPDNADPLLDGIDGSLGYHSRILVDQFETGYELGMDADTEPEHGNFSTKHYWGLCACKRVRVGLRVLSTVHLNKFSACHFSGGDYGAIISGPSELLHFDDTYMIADNNAGADSSASAGLLMNAGAGVGSQTVGDNQFSTCKFSNSNSAGSCVEWRGDGNARQSVFILPRLFKGAIGWLFSGDPQGRIMQESYGNGVTTQISGSYQFIAFDSNAAYGRKLYNLSNTNEINVDGISAGALNNNSSVDTINGGFDGQEIFLRSSNESGCTIVNGSIQLNGDVDFVMNRFDTLTLVKANASTWVEKSRMVR